MSYSIIQKFSKIAYAYGVMLVFVLGAMIVAFQ